MAWLSRRRALWIGIPGAVLLLALALAWWWWLPSIVATRAEAALEARLGLQVHVEGAGLGLTSVELHGIDMRSEGGDLSVEVARVAVDGSPFALAFEGPGAASGISAEGLRVVADVSRGDLAGTLRRLRSRATTRDGHEPASVEEPDAETARSVSVRGVTGELRDGDGVLAAVAGGSGSGTPEGLRVAMDEVTLGGDGGHRIRLNGVTSEVDLGHADAPVRLRRLEVEGGEAHWARSSSQSVGEGRLARGLAALRGSTGEASSDTATDGSSQTAWQRFLAPEAVLQLEGLIVQSATEAGEETILRDLSVAVERTGPARLELRGEGAPAEGGSLGWDIEVMPLELRAEGTLRFESLPLALVGPLLPNVPLHEAERAKMDGELAIRGEGNEPLHLHGSITLRDVGLYAPRVAPEPITGIDVTVEGEGTWYADERRLELTTASIRMGRATVRLEGALEWTSDHYVVDVKGTLPSTPCDAAVGAIPSDLLADVAGFGWSGQIGARLVASVDSRELEGTELDIDVFDACQFEVVPPMADLRRVQGPFLHRVKEPDGTWFEMNTGPGSGNWASLYEISPFLVHAVLAHEDASFFRHGGFAPWAIRDALQRNLEEGRYVLGASTISMQLAKNLFLHREKTLARKVQEVILTWWLEAALEKSGILELYLNIIEYGPGVYGIRRAASHWFGREPKDLSPAESAFLATILPAPKRYASQRQRGLSASTRRRAERLLRHMQARGRIDETALEHGVAELQHLEFAADDAPAAPRPLPPGAAPLPYEAEGDAWEEWESWETFEPDAEAEPGQPVRTHGP